MVCSWPKARGQDPGLGGQLNRNVLRCCRLASHHPAQRMPDGSGSGTPLWAASVKAIATPWPRRFIPGWFIPTLGDEPGPLHRAQLRLARESRAHKINEGKMAARPFIVFGDQTDHGGVVVEASVMTDTHGKGIARVGDQVTCPKRGHGTTVIVTGDPTMIIDGKPAARHGDKCACGATLISSQFVSTVGDGASPGTQASTSRQAQTSSVAAGVFSAYVEHPSNSTDPEGDLEYFFVAERDDGRPLPLAYRIDGDEGKLHEGRLGHNGETKAFPMSTRGEPIFWIPSV